MINRVVITGMGAVTPVGNDVYSFWNNIKSGKCGVDYISLFDTEGFDVKIAAEVKGFSVDKYFDKKEAKRLDRFCHFAYAAADEAIKDSNLDLDKINKNRFGVIVGSGIGGFSTMEAEYEKLFSKGPRRISPFFIPMTIINMASGNLAIKYGAKGLSTSVVTACAAGTNSIGEAFRNIKHGYTDIMLAGGAEAPITKIGVAGFSNLKALNPSNDINRSSIPFDKERNGFVIGEGAGILVLESLEHALNRGAKIYGEIVGYGATCDAYHVTSPDPEGDGAARAMLMAINEANIDKEEISYINPHGTSTPYNDKFETIAIKKVFNEYAYKVPVSSTKSMTGHLLGAAGAIEAVICIKALEEGFVPPTIGLKVRDEDCDLDYVPNEGRKQRIKYALSNSLGFGGHNATLVFKKWE
ncbi:3-oxoacyl-[acyl-carrier-protein] synthase II [Clostridium cavendishii DSM 21758]|uniref:3-oxoacyl-[acyl-carrier-protein] synthase 2 n=1 Tax=Clostridium cavendishii DSM 21758 TaxID=1121302 RepID=A0A1M6KHB1_9CLOT|nr:beta-ketoacyl-ACP synthase II [Clostridium cavendishii]SHJ58363.1 3-oxoacyl-[acyl-carrier-protein] synthase II [Clostridium cavendishii DSM 21758]